MTRVTIRSGCGISGIDAVDERDDVGGGLADGLQVVVGEGGLDGGVTLGVGHEPVDGGAAEGDGNGDEYAPRDEGEAAVADQGAGACGALCCSSAYYDRRPRLAVAGEAVLPIDDQVGLSPSLARLHQRQLSTVEGVGPVDGVLSHFEMVERWELGDMRGRGGQRAGFLARLAGTMAITLIPVVLIALLSMPSSLHHRLGHRR